MFRDRADHKVRRISDVGARAEKNGARADCQKERLRHPEKRTAEPQTLAQRGKRKICWSIIKEGRETSGRPEELPGPGQAKLRTPGLQKKQRRDHRDEDPEKNGRHFQDRAVVKIIRLPVTFGGDPERNKRRNKQKLATVRRRNEHCPDNDREAEEVPLSVQAESVRDMRDQCPGMFLDDIAIEAVKDPEQSSDRHQPKRKKFQGPEERNTPEESEKERRITEGGQRAADIADQKNKKDRKIRVMLPVRVRPEKRTDQNHAGACRSDKVAKHRAGPQKKRIGERRAFKPPLDPKSPGNNEQGPEQNDKRNIFFEAAP